MSADKSTSSHLQLAIPFLVVVIGMVLAWFILKSDRQPTKAAVVEYKPLVKTVQLQKTSHRPLWNTNGLVVPSSQTRLAFQVSGQVESILSNAVPGQLLIKGDELALLDTKDLQLAVLQQKAVLAQAQSKLAIEQGQADLAAEEFRLSGSRASTSRIDLVLRRPQLAAAQADVDIAQAALDRAETNLSRAQLTMPFNGQLVERNISLGTNVTPNTTAFTVVATDQFWVEVKLPRTFLNWLDKDHPVTLSLPQWQGRERQARLLNVLASVDDRDRQVKAIVAIDRPLDVSESLPNVLINDFVGIQLVGIALIDHYQIPRRWLVDQNQIWVVNQDKLYRRSVTMTYLDRDFAWVSAGFRKGDRLLVSQLDALIEGMSVRTEIPPTENLLDSTLASPQLNSAPILTEKGEVGSAATSPSEVQSDIALAATGLATDELESEASDDTGSHIAMAGQQ